MILLRNESDESDETKLSTKQKYLNNQMMKFISLSEFMELMTGD